MTDESVLFICTGNATRSVVAAAALARRRPDVVAESAGTLVVEGRPLSFRTRAGFGAIDIAPPDHRSRQATAALLQRFDLVVALAPEHVRWVHRQHPEFAAKSATLQRLCRSLPSGPPPLRDRVEALRLGDVIVEPWEEVVDPGGGDVDAFARCALEIAALIDILADRL